MPVSDRELTQLTQIATDARHGNADPACCEWLLSACAPLLKELTARRQAMANLNIDLSIDNVIKHPAVR